MAESNLNANAEPFNPHGQLAQDAYAAFRARAQANAQNSFDRGLFPESAHSHFSDRYSDGERLHYMALTVPVSPTSLDGTDAVRITAPCIWSVFNSLKESHILNLESYAGAAVSQVNYAHDCRFYHETPLRSES
jgi:hypothetical protein